MSILEQLFGVPNGAMPDSGSPEQDQLAVGAEIARRLKDQLATGGPQFSTPYTNAIMSAQPGASADASGGKSQVFSPPTPQPQPTQAPTRQPSVSPDGANGALAQRYFSSEPSGPDQLAAFLSGAGDRGQGLLGRIGGGMASMQGLDRDRLTQNVTYSALLKNGMPEDLAMAATLNAKNPAVAGLIGQVLSPKTQVVNNQLVDSRSGRVIADFRDSATKAGTANFKMPSGDEVTATFDPRIQGHVAPDGTILSGPLLGQNITALTNGAQKTQGAPTALPLPGATQPLGTNATASGAPQDQSGAVSAQGTPVAGMINRPTGPDTSIYAIPAAPVGANAKTWRDEQSKKTADEMATDRDKALGSIDFLRQAATTRDLLDKHGHVIGVYAQPTGSQGTASDPASQLNKEGAQAIGDTTDWLRNKLSDVRNLGAQLPLDPLGMNADNSARQLLNSAFTDLATTGLKAKFGRVTQGETKLQGLTVPNLNNADADTSRAILDRSSDQAWETLQRGINSGAVNVAAVPQDIIARGVMAGKLNIPSHPATQAIVTRYVNSLPADQQAAIRQAYEQGGVE